MYKKPTIKIISIGESKMICGSEPLKSVRNNSKSDIDDYCGPSCKIWHVCRDRKIGKYCYDKKY